RMGVAVDMYEGGNLSPEQFFVAGPGSGEKLASNASAVTGWLKSGGNLLSIGLNETELNAFLPSKVKLKSAEHIAAYFEPFAIDSPFAGIGPADVHNRAPREFPLVTGGASPVGDGILGKADGANVIMCQLVPWTLDYSKQYNLKRTFRRAAFT